MSTDFNLQNPLGFTYNVDETGVHEELRDPCIIREGDVYYLVFTVYPFAGRSESAMNSANQGSSPGIVLYSSSDLKNWSMVDWLVKSSELPDDCPFKHRFWAPEIHKIGGKFYLIFTADNWLKPEYNPAGNWGNAGYAFIGVADNVTGPYEHITYIDGGACDTSLFADDDGRTYALIPRMNVDIQEIDMTQLPNDKVTLLGSPTTIVTADNSDIGFEPRPTYLEAPWAFKRDGLYYLITAGPYQDKRFPDNLGYWAGVAYAEHPLGPWKKDVRGQVFLGGHMAVFKGPDGRNWFAYRGEEEGTIAHGRLCVDPFDFYEDGKLLTDGPSKQGHLNLALRK